MSRPEGFERFAELTRLACSHEIYAAAFAICGKQLMAAFTLSIA